jgi:dihydrolipoamide dehydrogenase
MSVEVRVPELGDFADVDVIEVHVKSGDEVAAEAPLITLETEKASMDVPAPQAGTVEAVKIKVGDKVSPGHLILTLRPAQVGAASAATASGGSGARESAVSRDSATDSRQKPLPRPARPAAPPAAARAPAIARETPQPRFGPKLLVIGSGPGGYTAAFRAADLGLEVTLVERYATLGGVCLNVGCIPSKALLHAARVIEEAHEARAFGLDFGEPKIDLDKLRRWKEGVVGQLTKGLAGMAKQRKVHVVQGSARFKSSRAVTVEHAGQTQEIAFDQCIIAAGSQPVRLPGTPDDPRIVDSTGALELAGLPERLLVIGGGIIGLEMATVYEALGVKVSVVELTKTLMPGCDRDLVRPLEKRLQKRYETIMLGTRVAKLEAQSAGVTVHFEHDAAPATPQTYDRVLVAVGRRSNGAALGAETAGIAVDARGFIGVDKQMRTNVPHIYAIGDVVGQPMLAHKASHEGKVAAEAAAGEKSFFDARVVPSVAYTDPEVAWVGLTEEEAKAKDIAVHKGSFPWAASGRSLSLGRSEGLTKLLFDAQGGVLLGAGIVGPNAGDLIAEATLAIELGCDAADIGLTVHPHPTLSETLAFAAEVAEGTVTDLYIPKK